MMASTFALASSFFVTNGHDLAASRVTLVEFDVAVTEVFLWSRVIHYALPKFPENDFLNRSYFF